MTQTSSQYLNSTSKEYAIYVNENRGIPRVSDGLKDAARKALWVIRRKGEKIKTSALSGEMTAENLYIHGDASGAISTVAAPFLNNIPLLEREGNFGNRIKPNAFGASRYTYVRTYSGTHELVYPDLDIVPLRENYDGSNVEPTTFLPIVPLVLLNGTSGMGVGWSTEILPHSLPDLIDATIAELDGKPIQKLVPKYTFSQCVAREVGPNAWEFKGVLEFVDSSTVRIKELPPGLLLEPFLERLMVMEEKGDIRDYVDSSTSEINLIVKMKRGTVDKNNLDAVVDFLKLRSKITERIVVVNWDFKSIVQYTSPEQVVKEFVAWRFAHYVRRYDKFLADDSLEMQYWLGIKACFDKGLPAQVSKLQNKKEIVLKIEDFTQGIALSADQIDSIASFPTYRWSKDDYQTVLDKIAKLQGNIANWTDLLANHKKIKAIFKSEVEKLRKIKFA